MIFALSCVIWALVLWSVWFYSKKEAYPGNWLTVLATSLGMIYFVWAYRQLGDLVFFFGHAFLFCRSAWMIHKEVR